MLPEITAFFKGVSLQLNSGNVKLERGAVVMRLSPSWFRIGSLEILAKKGELEELRRLVDTVLETLFPDITDTGDEAVLVMFSRVVDTTAELIARCVKYVEFSSLSILIQVVRSGLHSRCPQHRQPQPGGGDH